MPDYMIFYDSQSLGAHHLDGKSCVVKIARVTGGTLIGEGGKKSKRPLVYFEGKELPLALSKTDGKTISGMYGRDVSAWTGKLIEIFPTTTDAFGRKDVPCVRVKPAIPNGGK